ncbi:MAG: ATP-dependent Clp protease ATP-binding subunit [Planctomycetes bacterium]|nr:ATP-dependent Clp protease ATP-binding subunit [Planctomycetota bacterium]
MFWIGLVSGLGLFVLVRLVETARERRGAAPGPAVPAGPRIGGGLALNQPTEVRRQLYQLAAQLAGDYDQAAHPDDLVSHPGFRQAIELLASDAFTLQELLVYFTGDNHLIATVSAIAMGERDDGEPLLGPVLAGINSCNYYAREFALRALERRVDGPLLGPVLERVDATWGQPFALRMLREFTRRRLQAGDHEVPAAVIQAMPPEKAEWLAELVEEIPAPELAAALRGAHGDKVDVEFLRSVGKVWSPTDRAPRVVDGGIERHASEVRASLTATPARSVLLVGESGVGKTVALQHVTQLLLADGWVVFEAGAVEILAGQSYIGQVEQRMKDLMRAIAEKRKVLWIVPGMEELVLAGRHRYSTTSLLDVILPFVETGKVLIIGELAPESWERLLQQKPALRTAVDIVRIEPLGDAETLALAQRYAQAVVPTGAPPLLTPQLVAQAFQLTQQFLGAQAQPGNLLGFLEVARTSRAGGDPGAVVSLGLDDLLATLSRMTGLPRSILDDREGLDIDSLERHFHERVVGQPEAIACLVERVAMIKAGLTDPTRPQGVFLFTGPTGTGKTEIAKTLAAWLFGSPDRMIRLDMSEFQGFESLDRLLGEGDEQGRKEALVHQIRKQPFSVVLLDEIEKAHPNVWDLFLQVFDDGRLTDRRGRLADFRHAILIMTSNVGSEATRGAGMGFGVAPTSTGLDPGVEKALQQQFRPEFLNRIDRIVVFRSLGRAEMHRVLEKELRLVLERRGLRNRQWAVEWDQSALEFFLDRGFTPELGARPLRRTIERFLLAPLAKTIVNQKAPTGDQFLFVRSDGRGIDVQFVDPDAPEDGEPVAGAVVAVGVEPASLGAIALDPAGTRAELDLLLDRHLAISASVQCDAWTQRKQAALDEMATPDFWSRDDRFGVLAELEYRDRIEVGFETATNLVQRLRGPDPDARAQFSRELMRRLAEQLHLLHAAIDGLADGRAADAFVRVEALHDPRESGDDIDAFARAVAVMYRRWARRRRMEAQVLLELGEDGRTPYQSVLSVVGFGAFTLLRDESGLHVMETDESPDSGAAGHAHRSRLRVRVTVVGQPDEPVHDGTRELLRRARERFEAADIDGSRIVRRYRRDPSPLVRDAIRGWRTGRLDRVLDGDFDLMS